MENDPAVLDALLETESWQTLATFARESARKSLYIHLFIARHESIVTALIYFYYSPTTSTTRARRTTDSYHGRRHPARIIR